MCYMLIVEESRQGVNGYRCFFTSFLGFKALLVSVYGITFQKCSILTVGQSMRDIRQDLQERLRTVQAELLELRRHMGNLEEEKRSLASLLDMENRRWFTEPDFTKSPDQDKTAPS